MAFCIQAEAGSAQVTSLWTQAESSGSEALLMGARMFGLNVVVAGITAAVRHL